MKPAPLNLPTIWRGCDWGPVTLKWKNANGDPINLARFRPRAQSLNFDLHAVKSTTEVGTTTLSLSRDETIGLKLGVENWDWIWVAVNAQGVIIARYPPFLAGKISIKEPVTNVPGDLPPGIPDDTEPPIIDDTEPPIIIEQPPITLPS